MMVLRGMFVLYDYGIQEISKKKKYKFVWRMSWIILEVFFAVLLVIVVDLLLISVVHFLHVNVV
jgi:hypothetical protein